MKTQKYSLNDFYSVIDLKTGQWLRNPEFTGHLRPQTLFGMNFDAYVQEAHRRYKKQNIDQYQAAKFILKQDGENYFKTFILENKLDETRVKQWIKENQGNDNN